MSATGGLPSTAATLPARGGSAKPLLLVVEDELHLADVLIFNLDAEGYRTHHEADGEAALAYLRRAFAGEQEQPAAVLLDVMLPGIEGFEVARILRAEGNYLPILMLTARGRPEDVLAGFAAGADDYLPKPFQLSILLARVGGLLRRMAWQRHAASAPLPRLTSSAGQDDRKAQTEPIAGPRDRYHFNSHEIRFDTLEILRGSEAIRLTLMEAELLRYLIERAGRVVSRGEILEEVWRVREDTDTRAIDNFVVRLRRYLEADPVHPTHLLTVRGVGYRFVADGQWS